MVIGIYINSDLCFSKFNGIKIQAETWASELERQGHTVVKISPWSKSDLHFDIIHIIGVNKSIDEVVPKLTKYCDKLFLSPIIDTIQPLYKYKISTFWGISKLRLFSLNFSLRKASAYISKWIVRSEYEKSYVKYAYDIPDVKIGVVPLSYRIPELHEYPHKKNFCFHLSVLTDERKNVLRLLKAAVKYKFNLVLAGTIKSEKVFEPMKKIIEDNSNITYLGRVSEEQLMKLYKQAKVFALPSINEGVGMVALEAAAYGCDVVITNIGGPKEYYGDYAFKVDPYNINQIGTSIILAMNCTTNQPKLQSYVLDNFNLASCVNKLVAEYLS